MTEPLEGLEWAVAVVADVIGGRAGVTNQDIDDIVLALAEPLRRAGRVEELDALYQHELHMAARWFGLLAEATYRIEGLEAALRVVKVKVESCYEPEWTPANRVIGDLYTMLTALLDTEAEP